MLTNKCNMAEKYRKLFASIEKDLKLIVAVLLIPTWSVLGYCRFSCLKFPTFTNWHGYQPLPQSPHLVMYSSQLVFVLLSLSQVVCSSLFSLKFIVLFYICLLTKAFWLRTGKGASTSIIGTQIGPKLSVADKVWSVLTSMGNIALASTYAMVIYDIMVTYHSSFFIIIIKSK